jgi:hypothetical protein
MVYEISDASSTYYLCAYLWMRWKGDIDPAPSLDFDNAVDQSNFTRDLVYDRPLILKDGSKYQMMRVEGRFFAPFDFVNYPLDRQFLTVVLESNDWTADRLVFLPDDKDSGYSAQLRIPGWQMIGWEARPSIRNYATDFGQRSGSAGLYAHLEFDLVLVRPISFFLCKLLLPLVIVLMANWCALLLKPNHVDVRAALPATAMLTLVFLQKSYSDQLPAIGALMLMDKIYVVSYLMVTVTLAQIIVTVRASHLSPAMAARRDRTCLIVQILTFPIVIGLLLLSAWSAGWR